MNVLVVCHGNRFRSPLCAAVLRALRPDWAIRSAGVGPNVRGNVPTLVRETAHKWGMPLLDGRRCPCTAELILWAQRIIFMDAANWRRLRALAAPGATQAKGICLSWALGTRRIPDPAYARQKEPLFELVRTATERLVAQWAVHEAQRVG